MSLVELHGGRIEGHSAGLGQGSEFTIHLPALPITEHSGDLPLPETVPEAPRKSLSAHKVLIVDDNLDTAEIVANLPSSMVTK